MENVNSWSDTLTQFLKSSNEDERVIALFKQNILPEIKKYFAAPTFNWLEVGSGDGNKTLEIANAIKGLNKFENINLTICEPSIDWLITLQNSGIARRLSEHAEISYINKSIESLTDNSPQPHFDFVSLIQVLYDESILTALLKYIDKKPKDKSTLIWVDTEYKSGDFFKMRQALMKQGLYVVHSFIDALISALKSRRLLYKTYTTTNKICKITTDEVITNDSHWLFPFIVGKNIDEFDTLPEYEKKVIIKNVRKYVANLKQPLLNIPDISVLIYI